MRHLTIDQARAALRRGTTIEQLLAGGDRDGRAVARWLSLIPTKTGDIEMRLHYVFDVGSDDFVDVAEFPPVDDDEYIGEGKPMGLFRSSQDALQDAEREWSASPDRWVNEGDEYASRRNIQTP